jgi:NAD(P)-dependent dehydrogenase (short-subunit alcohol dehydrogenase family)
MRLLGLDGRVAAVTGSTSGVGAAVARALASGGAGGITVTGRDRGRGEAVAAEIEDAGCPTIFVAADLASPDACRSVVRATVERFGRIDALANCAGSTERGTLDTTTPELFDRIFAVNVRAPLLLMAEAIRDMRARGMPGTIVNIVSTSAFAGQPYLCAYSASKGALATLTRNAAYAHRFDRIRINGIMLGWTDTPQEDEVQRRAHGRGEGWLAEVEAAQPMGRLAKPDEVAKLVTFLLSDDSGIMTGSLVEYSQDVAGAAG